MARYYNVVYANFLTEDSYLGNIYEPLTLNRYNYCVSNPVNYRDPSGNDPINAPWAGMYEPVQPVVQFCENPILAILSQLALLSDIDTGLAPKGTTYIDEKVCQVYDSNSYYIGKCVGNIGTGVILTVATDGTAQKTVNGPKRITIFPAKNSSMKVALEGGGTLYGNVVETAGKTAREVVIPEEVIIGAIDAGVTSGLLYQSNLNVNASKVDWDSLVSGSEGSRTANGVGNPVKVEGRGSTGRTIQNTLNEQMAMHQVQSNPLDGAIDMSQLKRPTIMTDPRWPASEGWIKMSNNVNGIEIHFVYNKITGAFDDFKFK